MCRWNQNDEEWKLESEQHQQQKEARSAAGGVEASDLGQYVHGKKNDDTSAVVWSRRSSHWFAGMASTNRRCTPYISTMSLLILLHEVRIVICKKPAVIFKISVILPRRTPYSRIPSYKTTKHVNMIFVKDAPGK
jgi:hypothetical protein